MLGMTQGIKTLAMMGVLAAGLTGAAKPAEAHSNVGFSFGFSIGGPSYPPPVYYQPAPVVVAPQPYCYPPAPAVVYPAPYYAPIPGPVYVYPRHDGWRYRYEHEEFEHGWGRGWHR